MTCKHQFFTTRQMTKYRPGTRSVEKEGVVVTCANCGEVREIWDNGEVSTKVEARG